ncbi:PEP-CTERM sorting domain-containing protein [Catenovulum sediminis]|uniref:PEP-CTERM sorting domain-containing protein n=1 Tax=Catenovulum sediminis TaxID=1740262 RepID=UPI00117DCCEC|nr:PEP-CTERM sorting domain-containing protein [Catenovulum sediminis]
MNIKMLKAAVAGLALSVSGFANAGLIVGYAPNVEVTTGMDATGITWVDSNAEIYESSGGSFGDAITLRPSVAVATFSDAVAANDFFQFSISAQLSNSFDLETFSFHAYNGGASTPRGWVLRSSVDSFASDIDSSFITAPYDTIAPDLFSVDLSSFTSLTSIDFRVYAFAPTAGYAVNFGNLQIRGTVFDELGNEIQTQIPEPSTLAIFTLGIMGLASRRFKKPSIALFDNA